MRRRIHINHNISQQHHIHTHHPSSLFSSSSSPLSIFSRPFSSSPSRLLLLLALLVSLFPLFYAQSCGLPVLPPADALPCNGHGTCSSTTRACTCELGRYEANGAPSNSVASPTCIFNIESAQPTLYAITYHLILLILCIVLLGLLLDCIGVFRRARVESSTYSDVHTLITHARDKLLHEQGATVPPSISTAAGGATNAALSAIQQHQTNEFEMDKEFTPTSHILPLYFCIALSPLILLIFFELIYDPLARDQKLNNNVDVNTISLRVVVGDIIEYLLFLVSLLLFFYWRVICVPGASILSDAQFVTNSFIFTKFAASNVELQEKNYIKYVKKKYDLQEEKSEYTVAEERNRALQAAQQKEDAEYEAKLQQMARSRSIMAPTLAPNADDIEMRMNDDYMTIRVGDDDDDDDEQARRNYGGTSPTNAPPRVSTYIQMAKQREKEKNILNGNKQTNTNKSIITSPPSLAPRSSLSSSSSSSSSSRFVFSPNSIKLNTASTPSTAPTQPNSFSTSTTTTTTTVRNNAISSPPPPPPPPPSVPAPLHITVAPATTTTAAASSSSSSSSSSATTTTSTTTTTTNTTVVVHVASSSSSSAPSSSVAPALPPSSSAEFHSLRVRPTNEIKVKFDEEEVDEQDANSSLHPVPPYFRNTIYILMLLSLALLIILIISFVARTRVLFAALLFVITLFLFSIHLSYMYSFYSPLYLAALSDIQKQVIPRVQLLRIGQMHYILHYICGFYILISIVQLCIQLWIASSDELKLTSYHFVLSFLFLRILQLVRIATIVIVLLPIQHFMSILTLHSCLWSSNIVFATTCGGMMLHTKFVRPLTIEQQIEQQLQSKKGKMNIQRLTITKRLKQAGRRHREKVREEHAQHESAEHQHNKTQLESDTETSTDMSHQHLEHSSSFATSSNRQGTSNNNNGKRTSPKKRGVGDAEDTINNDIKTQTPSRKPLRAADRSPMRTPSANAAAGGVTGSPFLSPTSSASNAAAASSSVQTPSKAPMRVRAPARLTPLPNAPKATPPSKLGRNNSSLTQTRSPLNFKSPNKINPISSTSSSSTDSSSTVTLVHVGNVPLTVQELREVLSDDDFDSESEDDEDVQPKSARKSNIIQVKPGN